MEGKRLKKEYFIMFAVRIGIITIMTGGIIACAVNESSISTTSSLLFYGLIIVFSLAELFCIYDFAKYCRDFKAAKNLQFEELSGTVIKFAKNQDASTGVQINSIPIIQVVGSNEMIKLRINGFLKIGETYNFIYLKYTKMGAVKETTPE